jgi:hypothetical protein
MALDVDDVVKHVVMIVVVNVKKDALASSLMVVTHRRDVGRRVVLVSQGTTPRCLVLVVTKGLTSDKSKNIHPPLVYPTPGHLVPGTWAPGTWAPGHLGTWAPGYLGTWVPGTYLAPGHLGTWVPGTWVPGYLRYLKSLVGEGHRTAWHVRIPLEH